MTDKIDKKFQKINKELNKRSDLVDQFKASWKKSSGNNAKIQKFLEVEIKDIFRLDYGEFTITLGGREICITMWHNIKMEDIKKFDRVMGKESKIICEDEFIYLKYEFEEYY
ncbi:hypothetical protein [uncultured Methanobrevibacter sp.]|uniref:hypothetical protein n=1 Tax=uncultured Methanobrevibacter sp. TaxID=253161 RepID=UPI0025E6DD30|nr:hypothetical protein [uncultured Methanobrevibacter sp.]